MAIVLDGTDAIGDLGDALNAKLTSSTAASTYLPIAGGKILQVVRATDTTYRSTTSTSPTDVGISVTITPQKSDSSVIIIASHQKEHSVSTTLGRVAYCQITDSANTPLSGAQNAGLGWYNGTHTITAMETIFGYASPGVTTAVTYKLRFNVASSAFLALRNDTITGQMYAIEVSA